jgi:exopolysaccharide biosynthesis polyprenyl glycosylphosphotransferase
VCINWYKKKKVGRIRVLIAGLGKEAREVVRAIKKHPEKGYEVVGFVGNDQRKELYGIKVFHESELERIIKEYNVHKVIIAIPPSKKAADLILKLEEAEIAYATIPTLYDVLTRNVSNEIVDNFPFLFEDPIQFEGRVIKRIVDIAGSIFGLFICAIPMLIIAILIKLDSKGPVFFRQKRVGKNGKEFLIYKFRTMVKDAPKVGPILTEKDDPRITKVGKLLRKTSLDELPQLLNVLKGEMSLVGPRPEIPEIVKDYTPWQRQVLRVKPGITGIAQINGREENDIPKKLRLDMYYIKHQSLGLDLKILFQTIPEVIKQRGAY